MTVFIFFCLRPEIPVLGKFGPKNLKCQFKLKFDTKTNLNMQNSIVMVTFCSRPKASFLGKFCLRNQNCQFKLKFGFETISDMQNSMVMFSFSVFDLKYPFWVVLAQKLRIVSLSLNLVRGQVRLYKT